MNGGYIIVPINGFDVTDGDAQTIEGIYAGLEEAIATNKPIWLSGAMNGDAELSPIPCAASMGAAITVILPGVAMTVTSDDEVTPLGA